MKFQRLHPRMGAFCSGGLILMPVYDKQCLMLVSRSARLSYFMEEAVFSLFELLNI